MLWHPTNPPSSTLRLHYHCSIDFHHRLHQRSIKYRLHLSLINTPLGFPWSESFQNTRKHEIESTWLASPGGNSSPLDSSLEKPRNGLSGYVAWRYKVSPPGSSSTKPETSTNYMSRLAAMHSPPGGFWKNSRIHKKSQYNHSSCIFITHLLTFHAST